MRLAPAAPFTEVLHKRGAEVNHLCLRAQPHLSLPRSTGFTMAFLPLSVGISALGGPSCMDVLSQCCILAFSEHSGRMHQTFP